MHHFLVRTYCGISVLRDFAPSDHKDTFRFVSSFRAEVLNLGLIVITKIIKPQTVLLFIHDGTQYVL